MSQIIFLWEAELTALDDRLGPKALALILKYGKTATVDVTTYAYTTSSGGTTPTVVSHTVKISPPEAYEISMSNANTVQQGDMKCMIAALGLAFTPKIGIEIVFDSQRWKVVSFEPVYSGDLVVVWIFQLRK